MLGGAALLPIAGFLAGVLVTRRWRRSPAEQPRIRRNRLVWQIFQWLLLEVWPESHWPGFALRKADVFQSGIAW